MDLERRSLRGRWLLPRPLPSDDRPRPGAPTLGPADADQGARLHGELLARALPLWSRLDPSEARLSDRALHELAAGILHPELLGKFRLRRAAGASGAAPVGRFFRLRAAFFQGRRAVPSPRGGGSVILDGRAQAVLFQLERGPCTWPELRDAVCRRDPGISADQTWSRIQELIEQGFVETQTPGADLERWRAALQGCQGPDARRLLDRLDQLDTVRPQFTHEEDPPEDLPGAAKVVEARHQALRRRREISVQLGQSARLAQTVREVRRLLALPEEGAMPLLEFLRGYEAWSKRNSSGLALASRSGQGRERSRSLSAKRRPAPEPPPFRLVRDGSGLWTAWEPTLGLGERGRRLHVQGDEVWEEQADGSRSLPARSLSWLPLLHSTPALGPMRRMPDLVSGCLRLTAPTVVLGAMHTLPDTWRPPSSAEPETLARYGGALELALGLGPSLVLDRLPPSNGSELLCVDLGVPASVACWLEWWSRAPDRPVRARPLPQGGTFVPDDWSDPPMQWAL